MTWYRKIDGMAHQARKRFGQHFLVDQSIIAAIISRIRPHSLDRVLEIGPGLGAMTFSLIDHLSTLDVVELDRDLVKYWQAKEISKLQIYEADALQFDFLDWANLAQQDLVIKNHAGRVKIVGNLPYNISSPLLFHLMLAIESVDEQIFMLQKEVVDRMVAKVGDSEYGRLSVMLGARYQIEHCFDVPPVSFDPPPKVNSAIVAMYPRRGTGISAAVWHAMEILVAKAFAQRRKVLANNLGDYKQILDLNGSILRARAQEISIEQYLLWAEQIVDRSGTDH